MTTPMTLARLEAMVRRKQQRLDHATRRVMHAIDDAFAAKQSLAKAIKVLTEFKHKQGG